MQVIVVSALLALATCGSSNVRIYGAEGDGGGGLAGPMTSAQPFGTVGITSLCRKDADPAALRTVEPMDDSDSLKVRRFTVAPKPNDKAYTAFDRKPIEKSLGPVNHRVTVRCSDRSNLDWLYIEVARPTASTETFHGLRIVDDTGKEFKMDFSLTVCRHQCPDDEDF